jgi:hypothetical protein
MAKCPPAWKGSDTRNRCEHPDGIYRDSLLDAPLTRLSTNTTYQNWHCAYSHRDLDSLTTVIWDASVTCYDSYEPTTLSDETIAEHLSFNPVNLEWNLNVSLPTSDMKSSKSTPVDIQRSTDNNKQEIHPKCDLEFIAPDMDLPTRWCNPNVVRMCSDSWEDAEVKAQCEAYTARVCSGWKTYRNRHCLLCNHFDIPEKCYIPEFLITPGPEMPELPSFTKLLRWRNSDKACESSEKYDPISRVCRKVFL